MVKSHAEYKEVFLSFPASRRRYTSDNYLGEMQVLFSTAVQIWVLLQQLPSLAQRTVHRGGGAAEKQMLTIAIKKQLFI